MLFFHRTEIVRNTTPPITDCDLHVPRSGPRPCLACMKGNRDWESRWSHKGDSVTVGETRTQSCLLSRYLPATRRVPPEALRFEGRLLVFALHLSVSRPSPLQPRPMLLLELLAERRRADGKGGSDGATAAVLPALVLSLARKRMATMSQTDGMVV